MEAKKPRIPAVGNDTKGGKSAMSGMNLHQEIKKPVLVVTVKPVFKGITHKD